MKKICTIYRSPKKEGMYLYVDKAEDLARVPEALLQSFGKPEQAMTLLRINDDVFRQKLRELLQERAGTLPRPARA